MKIKSLLPLLFLISVGGLFAQTKPTLAILPFTGGNGEDGETIAELFSFDQTLNSVFAPMPRTSINNAIRREQNFQITSGMTDPETISRIGHQLGARYIVAGTITSLGRQQLLVISILQIENLQQIAGDWRTYNDIGEIVDKIPEMTQNIVTAYRKDTSRLQKLAVLPFQTPSGDREADALSQILAAEIARGGTYAVYPRTKTLEQVQTEYTNQLSGDTADNQAISIGRGDNPLLALSGAVRSLGANRRMLNAAIINVESGIQEKGDSANYNTIEEGTAAIRALAVKLTGVILPTQSEYRVSTNQALLDAFDTINKGEARNYTIILTNNVSFPSQMPKSISLSTNGQTITVRGDGANRTLSECRFSVRAGATLVLTEGVELRGGDITIDAGGTLRMETGASIARSDYGAVVVLRNGVFIMNGGTISDGKDRGVYVDGTFTMNGGTISNINGNGVIIKGTFTMNGGTIKDNKTSGGGSGAGVCMYEGSFTMTGGTISGNTAREGGGVSVNPEAVFIKTGGTIDASNRASTNSNGHVVLVYVRSGPNRVRNSAAGPSVRLDSRTAGRAGGWE